MPNYTFRIHKFTLIDNHDNDVNTNNQYVNETVSADTVEDAMTQMRAKHGDETQARIFLRGVN